MRDLLLVQRWFQRGFARSSTALPGGLRNSRLVQIIRGRYVEHVAGAPKYLSGALARITRNHRETIWLTLPCWRSLRYSVSVATRKKKREKTWLNAHQERIRTQCTLLNLGSLERDTRSTESGEIHERLLKIYQLIPSTVVSVKSLCASTCNSNRPRWIRLTDYSTKIITGEFTTQYGNIRPSKLTPLHHYSISVALFR